MVRNSWSPALLIWGGWRGKDLSFTPEIRIKIPSMTTTGVNYLWSFIRKVSHLRARGQQVIPLTFVGLLDCIQVPDMNNLEAGGACHELWAAIVIRGGPGNHIIYTTCSTLTGHFFYLHGVNISRVIVKGNRNNNNIFVKTNLLMLQNCVASVLGVAFLPYLLL